MREDPKIHGTDAERKLFTTENQSWKKTASKLAEAGVGTNFFIAAPGGAYVDVATIGTWILLEDRNDDLANKTQGMLLLLPAARHSSIPISMPRVISSRCEWRWLMPSTGTQGTSA